MKELVMNVINISGQTAIIFVVLLVVRGIFALGRVPKKYAYGLWAILFIRLLLPIQLEARWGLMPQVSVLTRAVESIVDAAGRGGQDVFENSAGGVQYAGGQEVPGERQNMFGGQKVPGEGQNMFGGQKVPGEGQNMFAGKETPGERQNMFEGQEIPKEWKNMFESQAAPEDGDNMSGDGQNARLTQLRHGNRKAQSVSPAVDAGFGQLTSWAVVVGVWISGSILLMGYGLFSYFGLKRVIRCSLRLEGWGDGIYLVDGIETPFVLGVFAPKIYLPSNMAGENYSYVIAHEKIHIRRRDYLFKLGAYLLTCLYWFHPLVWAGFILMGRDMEMSCDEAVLRLMEGDCRREYADSLLQLSCGRHYPAAAPPAFGEGNIRGRIKHIMGYRKVAAAVAAAAVVLTGILAAVLLASPREAAQEGNPSEESMEQAEAGRSGQGAETANGMSGQDTGMANNQMPSENGSQEFSVQVAYRDVLFSAAPVMTGNTPLGADGAILDYADEDKVIFHGYFGLYVYSVSTGETVGTVDLQALGCGDTQGDNTCQVLVSRDGSKVYFFPLGGISMAESSSQKYSGSRHRLTLGGEPVASVKGLDRGEQGYVIYSYVYDVADGRLRIVSWNLEQSGDSYAEIEFSRLTGEELSVCRAVPVAEVEQNIGQQGVCSYHGMVFEKDGEQVFGYLKSASETLEDLVYVQRPIDEENLSDVQKPGDGERPGTVKAGDKWRKVVRMFGANGQGGSIVSYNEEETAPRITIDGTTYDLGQVMTECRYGDRIMEYPLGNTSVNAITGLQCVDGFWIVEGHMSPNHSTYSFYDPAEGEWLGHVVGAYLTWSNRDEKLALWDGNSRSRISTIIYALDNEIYSLQDGLLAFIPLEQDEKGTVSLPKEEICGLYRSGEEITVEIRSTQTEERRTVQFHDGRSELGPGVIKLNNLSVY